MRVSRLLFLSVIWLPHWAAPANEPYSPSREEVARSYQRAADITRARNAVLNGTLSPRWIGDGHAFWYKRQLPGGAHEYVRVESKSGHQSLLFDHARMAAALAAAWEARVDPLRLPLDEMQVSDDEKSLTVVRESQTWSVDLSTFEVTRITREQRQQQRERPGTSPDGRMRYEIRDGRLRLYESGTDGHVLEGSISDVAWASWAPDSRHLAVFRVIPGDRKQVYLITSSPQNGGRATFTARDYDLPGDKLDTYETYIVDAQARTETKSDLDPFWTGGRPWAAPPRPTWFAGRLLLQITERGYQAVRIVEVDLITAKSRTLIEERSNTFVDTTALIRRDLPNSNEILFRSERDGFGRLYLFDARTGLMKNAVTPPNWIVRSIEHIDEQSRTITFSANNTDDRQDPYFIHWFKVGLDGRDLIRLTESNGQHRVNFSPNRAYLVATWSRVGFPPVHELRDGRTGKLISVVESADIEAWKEFGIRMPEVFVAKGRDEIGRAHV